MAVIDFRENSYRVRIRKKNLELTRTFDNEEDAKLWAKYKENLIDLIDAFNPPLKEMITLQDAIELKIREVQETCKDINDFTNLIKYFEDFCPKPINEITYNDYALCFDKKLKEPIRKGGDPNNEQTGVKKLPSPSTVFRKFQYLSSVYTNLIETGVEIDNHPLKLCQFMRQKLKLAS